MDLAAQGKLFFLELRVQELETRNRWAQPLSGQLLNLEGCGHLQSFSSLSFELRFQAPHKSLKEVARRYEPKIQQE